VSGSAFHPATIGALYGVLATHEQALIQMALAANVAQADVDPEIAERYGAVVDDVKRLITPTDPPVPGRLSVDVSEMMRNRYRLLGDLMVKLADFDIRRWSFDRYEDGGIDANVHYKNSDKDVRTMVRAIADRIGVAFVDERHGNTGTQLIICARGYVDGTPVRIWELIEAERPICDTHHVMVDPAGVCPQCPEAIAEGQLLAELRRAHAPEQHLDMQVCTTCSEKHETPVRWPCAPLKQFEIELGGPEVRAEVRRTHFGTKDSEYGRVCAGCTNEQGVPVLWPCLLLRTADRIEDVPSADAGLVPIAPPDSDAVHALQSDGGETPRCGRAGYGSPVAVFLADVTCPECRRRVEAQLAEENGSDDMTDTTTTELPGDAP